MESLAQTMHKQLLSAASAGSTAFETSGVLELPKPLEVFFKDHNNQTHIVTFPLPGNDPTELQPLLDACSPAMFGRGRQILHDEAVRKARQLPVDRLGLSLTGPLPSEAILGEIKNLMMPDADGPIRADAYALNIYSPDGFFKAHRDTPASTDMFGSLILCLPTEFTGGQLIVSAPDLSTAVTHDWGSTSSSRLGTDSSGSSSCGGIAWAAMYSDCEHEIKPVTTGHRVTLTYNLYRPLGEFYYERTSSGSGSSQDSDFELSAAARSTALESAFGAQLGSALSDAMWYPAGVTLGLALEHSYADTNLGDCAPEGRSRYSYGNDMPRGNMPDSIEPWYLKGSDLLLYRAARAYGLDVKILPAVSLERWEKQELSGAVAPDLLPTDKVEVLGSFLKDAWEIHWRNWEGDWAAFLRGHLNYGGPGTQESSGKEAESESERMGGGGGGGGGAFDGEPQSSTGQDRRPAAAEISGELLWVKPPGKQHLKYGGPLESFDISTGTSYHYYYAAAVLLVVVPPAGATVRQG